MANHQLEIIDNDMIGILFGWDNNTIVIQSLGDP